MRHLGCVLVFLILSACVAPSLSSEESDAACVAASKAYVLALLTHDASPIPLHPHCIRMEDGVVTGLTGHDIAVTLDTFPGYRVITGIKNETYVVETGIVMANYIIEASIVVPFTTPVLENFTCESYNGAQMLRRIVALFSITL